MTTSDKRKLILDGAEKIFAAKGFAGSKVEEIAEQAGVAKGTIYLYFPSKEEVFISLIEERVNELISLVQERIKGLDCAIKILRLQVKTQIEFYTEHAGLLDVAFQYAPRLSYKLQQRLNKSRLKLVQISIDSIKELVSNPKSISVNTMAAMLDGAVNNLLINYFLNDYPIEAEEIADQIVTIFLPGLLQQQG